MFTLVQVIILRRSEFSVSNIVRNTSNIIINVPGSRVKHFIVRYLSKPRWKNTVHLFYIMCDICIILILHKSHLSDELELLLLL